MTFSRMASRLGRLLSDNSPMILTGIGIAGTITTALLAGQASFKAAEIIFRAEDVRETKLSTREKVELTWGLYLPAVGSTITTVGCIVLAQQIGHRRAVAMAAAYALSDRAFDEYREKIIEKVGEKKEQTYRDEIAQERVSRDASSREVIIISNDVLCYDAFSGRYFTSNAERIRRAQNDINHQVNTDCYASLTDFYSIIGLAPTSMSDEVGWNVDRLMDLKFSTTMSPDGRPCLSFDFTVSPVRSYYRLQ